MGNFGMFDMSSFVNTDLNWSLSISAFFVLSEVSIPLLSFKVGIPVESLRRFLTKDQNCFLEAKQKS